MKNSIFLCIEDHFLHEKVGRVITKSSNPVPFQAGIIWKLLSYLRSKKINSVSQFFLNPVEDPDTLGTILEKLPITFALGFDLLLILLLKAVICNWGLVCMSSFQMPVTVDRAFSRKPTGFRADSERWGREPACLQHFQKLISSLKVHFPSHLPFLDDTEPLFKSKLIEPISSWILGL